MYENHELLLTDIYPGDNKSMNQSKSQFPLVVGLVSYFYAAAISSFSTCCDLHPTSNAMKCFTNKDIDLKDLKAEQ